VDKVKADMHIISYCYKLGTYKVTCSVKFCHIPYLYCCGFRLSIFHPKTFRAPESEIEIFSKYDPIVLGFLINIVYLHMENKTTQICGKFAVIGI
jgi:hypothetical protein